jgi:hypothetical protein
MQIRHRKVPFVHVSPLGIAYEKETTHSSVHLGGPINDAASNLVFKALITGCWGA